MHEEGRRPHGPPVRYGVPVVPPEQAFPLPVTLFTQGWIHVLEDSEIAFILMMAALHHAAGGQSFMITADERLRRFGMKHDGYEAHMMLSRLASSRHPRWPPPPDGTVEEFNQEGKALPHVLRFIPAGFDRDALATLGAELDRRSAAANGSRARGPCNRSWLRWRRPETSSAASSGTTPTPPPLPAPCSAPSRAGCCSLRFAAPRPLPAGNLGRHRLHQRRRCCRARRRRDDAPNVLKITAGDANRPAARWPQIVLQPRGGRVPGKEMGVASQAEGPYPACLADRTAAWPRGGADGGILHRSDYAGEGGDRMQRPVVQVFVGDEIQVQSSGTSWPRSRLTSSRPARRR